MQVEHEGTMARGAWDDFVSLCSARDCAPEDVLGEVCIWLICRPRLASDDGCEESGRSVVAETAVPQGMNPHDTGNDCDESYRIERPDHPQAAGRHPGQGDDIRVTAHTRVGLFRGLCALATGDDDVDERPDADALSNSLHDSFSDSLNGSFTAPQKPWRGCLLDVARYQCTVAEIKQVIDMLALHRMSVLHLHLTDHQSWRMPVPGFARLDALPGLFSPEELHDLRDYARSRYVEIVPEIDLPGHCAALLAVYPELAGLPSFPHVLMSYIGPDTPLAARFLRGCVDALVDLATGPYIHIGGDEVFGMPQDRYDRALDILVGRARERGAKVIGWQEASRAAADLDAYQYWMSDADIPSEADLVSSWPKQYEELARKAAAMYAQCHDDPQRFARKSAAVVDSRQTWWYLDRKYAESSLDEDQNTRMNTLGFPGYASKDSLDVCDWDPLPTARRDGAVEACVWTETVHSVADLETLLLPRLGVLAAAAWRGRALSRREATVLCRRYRHAWAAMHCDGYYRSATLFS